MGGSAARAGEAATRTPSRDVKRRAWVARPARSTVNLRIFCPRVVVRGNPKGGSLDEDSRAWIQHIRHAPWWSIMTVPHASVPAGAGPRAPYGSEAIFMPSNDNHVTCAACPRSERSGIDRRELLRVAGLSAGALSALIVGKMIVMSNIVVARDANGVYGMSAVCTHEGCLLDDGSDTVASGLSCACHGSKFDGNGAVTAGPARQALQHFAVTIAADGAMTVDGSQPVAASARTAVN